MPHPDILLIGALNVRNEDRYMAREDLRSVQLWRDGRPTMLSFFDTWGEFGVSSMCWAPDAPLQIYVSTGTDLLLLDLSTGQVRDLGVPDLGGVHEIDWIDGLVYLSNTRFDEVVAYDPQAGQVHSCVRLASLSEAVRQQRKEKAANEIVDKYHCNQVLKGYDGDIYCLVHHATGRQLVQRVAAAIIKGHGNGGVINLQRQTAHNLSLKAPHSVRKLRGQYWAFSSAHSLMHAYDQQWNMVGTYKTAGFGRGACADADERVFYIGISPPRKRYLDVLSDRRSMTPLIELFSMEQRQSLGTWEVPGVEQINNLYTLSREQAEGLLALRGKAWG